MKLNKCSITLLLLLCPAAVFADNSLLYLEVQGVGGYSSLADKAIYYSNSQQDAMQKPSIGFDYVNKLSGPDGDLGMVAIQARAAYDDTIENKIDPQIYNAYFKGKFDFSDLWLGHNRPSFGLSSYLDSHGLLLQPLSMEGFGFERDWGMGFYRALEKGDIGLSVTTGSGMPLKTYGNYLVNARASQGVLDKDNYTVGLSLAYGQVLDTIGNNIIDSRPKSSKLAGLDMAYLINNFEIRLESDAGKKEATNVFGALCRLGVNLLDENRLKLEIQAVLSNLSTGTNAYKIYYGVSYAVDSSLSVKAMYVHDETIWDNRVIGQVYYYYKV